MKVEDLKDLTAFKSAAAAHIHQRRLQGVLVGQVDPTALRPPFAFWWCFCVQDSPDNPCPCVFPPFLVWVLDRPVDVSPLDRRTTDGHSLHEITLDSQCRVTVDVPVGMTAGDLAKIGDSVLHNTDCHCGNSRSTEARSNYLRERLLQETASG